MLETAGVIVTFAALFAVVGLPLAIVLRTETEGWVAVLADSLSFGLVIATVGITTWTWIGPIGAAVSALSWLAVLVLAVRKRRNFPSPSLSLIRAWPMTIVWIAIFAIAILLRLNSVNFLPWVGDMGAYVNWANEFARTGDLVSSWPPLFPVYLAMSSFAFGIAHTGSAVGLGGILLLVTVVRLLQRMSVGRPFIIGAAVLLALQPTAVWFSTFPVSESLNAPIFTAWLMLGYASFSATGRRLWLTLATQALFMLALGLLRGSGTLLMIPLLIVLVGALAFHAWRSLAGRMLLVTAANFLGAALGYWYGVTTIRSYFVDMQIKGLIPHSLADLLDELGLLSPTPVLVVALVVPLFALTWWGMRRFRADQKSSVSGTQAGTHSADGGFLGRPRAVPIFFLIIGVCLTVGIALGAAVGAMVWFIILRLGVWLLAGAVLAIVLAGFRRVNLTDQLLVAILAMNILLFVGLHTVRLGFNRGHDFYRYWDRYLFSEVLPASLLLTALALSVVVPVLARKWKIVVALAASAAAIVPAVEPLALQSQHSYLGGAYDYLNALSKIGGDARTPRIWVDTSTDRLDNFFFVNTWMAFAVPLRRTFMLNIVNAPQSDPNFGPDEVLSDTSLLNYAACEPGHEVVVYEVQNVGKPLDERVSDTRIALTYLGSTTSSITTLVQPPVDDAWTVSAVTVKAWRASVPAGTAPIGACVTPPAP